MVGWSLPMFLAAQLGCDVAEVRLLRRSDVWLECHLGAPVATGIYGADVTYTISAANG